MLFVSLDPIFCDEGKKSWELHGIVKAWVEPKDREVRRLVRPILEWLIWSCAKGRNEETSAAETDTNVAYNGGLQKISVFVIERVYVIFL